MEPALAGSRAASTKSGRRSLAFDTHKMDTDEGRLARRLERAWTDACASARKIQQGITIRPAAFDDVFHFMAPDRADHIVLAMKPVVFQVPERGDRPGKQIYVVVEGRLTFDRAALQAGQYLATHFKTHVGYFRYKDRVLTHIYGAHYDLDESNLGHPVFHHQIQTMAELGDALVAQFALPIDKLEDPVQDLFRQARVPTAHMDVFSIIAQICADHLLHKGSGAGERGSFKKVLQSCNVYKGVGHRIGRLNSGDAPTCYRSLHWYPEST